MGVFQDMKRCVESCIVGKFVHLWPELKKTDQIAMAVVMGEPNNIFRDCSHNNSLMRNKLVIIIY